MVAAYKLTFIIWNFYVDCRCIFRGAIIQIKNTRTHLANKFTSVSVVWVYIDRRWNSNGTIFNATIINFYVSVCCCTDNTASITGAVLCYVNIIPMTICNIGIWLDKADNTTNIITTCHKHTSIDTTVGQINTFSRSNDTTNKVTSCCISIRIIGKAFNRNTIYHAS